MQMQPEERQEVTDLLEFKENTAAGRMTTEYIALPVTATANDAIEAMRAFEGRMENMSTDLPDRFAWNAGGRGAAGEDCAGAGGRRPCWRWLRSR